MSNQPENENQQAETVSAEELRECLLTELEASKQAVAELSDEQLEAVAGGRKHHDNPQNSTTAILTSGVMRGAGLGIFRHSQQQKDKD